MDYILQLFLEVVPFVITVALVHATLRAVLLKRRDLSRENWPRECVRLAFVCYMAGLLALVWTPNGMWGQLRLFLQYGWPMDFWKCLFTGEYSLSVPFLDLLAGERTLGEFVRTMLVGNVLMYVPLGLLLPLRWPKLTVPKALAAGMAIDLIIEVVQPVFGRSFDTEDVVCNTLGVALGLGTFALARLASPKLVEGCQRES